MAALDCSLGFARDMARDRPLGPAAARRDSARHAAALDALERAARGTDNLMPSILECVRAYSTVGEICNRLRAVFGVHKEPSVI